MASSATLRRSLLLALTLLVTPAVAPADVLDVPGEFTTIQSAIDAALDGDEIVVQPGVYSGAGNTALNFGGRLITVRSTAPSSPAVVAATVIDCDAAHLAFLFDSGESELARVEGLTIRNGAANLLGTIRTRLLSTPTFADCVIRDCAGLAISPTQQGRITLERCTIESNGAGSSAALTVNYPLSGATVRDCVFRENAGGAIAFGGGLYVPALNSTGDGRIASCTFLGNTGTEEDERRQVSEGEEEVSRQQRGGLSEKQAGRRRRPRRPSLQRPCIVSI